MQKPLCLMSCNVVKMMRIFWFYVPTLQVGMNRSKKQDKDVHFIQIIQNAVNAGSCTAASSFIEF